MVVREFGKRKLSSGNGILRNRNERSKQKEKAWHQEQCFHRRKYILMWQKAPESM